MNPDKAPRRSFASVAGFRYSVLVLPGALACTVLPGAPAGACSFSSADSKHASPHPHAVTRLVYIADRGRFEWLSPVGKQAADYINRIVVSLADQRLYAYHDRQLLAWSTVSSGCAGHETPTGSFTISQKDVDHHSNLYENAPMPFFLRLTDDGLGLHAGFNPGYPASHGCLRLPLDMARELFQHVGPGAPVEITSSAPAELSSTGRPAAASSQL